jgi:TrmH family RNA methyltransferase
VLEGYRLIDEAIKVGADLDMLFMTPDFNQTSKGKRTVKSLSEDVTIKIIAKSLLKKVADTVNPQGIIAIGKKINYDPDNLQGEASNILILDRVQDPGNMGTLIRTAAAAGIDSIIALKGSVDIYNLKVLRATMGAIFRIPIIDKMKLADLNDFLLNSDKEFQIVCAEPSSDKYYYETKYQKPLMLVIGNEAHGVRDELIGLSDFSIKIPLQNNVESLNAAMAGGIILYNVMYNN